MPAKSIDSLGMVVFAIIAVILTTILMYCIFISVFFPLSDHMKRPSRQYHIVLLLLPYPWLRRQHLKTAGDPLEDPPRETRQRKCLDNIWRDYGADSGRCVSSGDHTYRGSCECLCVFSVFRQLPRWRAVHPLWRGPDTMTIYNMCMYLLRYIYIYTFIYTKCTRASMYNIRVSREGPNRRRLERIRNNTSVRRLMYLIRRRSIIGGVRERECDRMSVCVCVIFGERASSGGEAAGCAVVFARETCREWRGDVLQMFEIPTSFPAPIYTSTHIGLEII